MPNIYASQAATILAIKKHTPKEWSFLLDWKITAEPGKFMMLSLPEAGEAPIAISGFYQQGIELTVRKAGKVTSALFTRQKGQALFVRGPYGTAFPLGQFDGKKLLVISGGSGITAIKPVIEYYLKSKVARLAKLDILVGFRSPRQILFKSELQRWSRQGRHCQTLITVDTTEGEEEEWLGGIGFVVKFINRFKQVDAETRVIIVGSPLMMTNTIRELFLYGVKAENIWLSFERHMKCGVGKCGHCRIRDKYVCLDGPVFNYLETKELID